MTLPLPVAVGRPGGVGDGIVETEDIVGAHRPFAVPAFGFRGVVELQGVIDAERHGERVGILAKEFAYILGADLWSTRVVEVRIRVHSIALGDRRLAADHGKEHRLLLPQLLIESPIESVRESRSTAEADGKSPIFGEFVQAAQLTPAEIRPELIGAREAELTTRKPISAKFAGEGEEDPEVLFAETADGDARGGRVVAQQEDGLADDRAAGGVALLRLNLDTGGARRDGATDIDRQGWAAHALAFIACFRSDTGDAFAPIRERAGGVQFIDLRFDRQDDRRPGAGVE